jgi:hypothetical protein
MTPEKLLLRWIQSHGHHAHTTPDGRICIGIAAIELHGERSTSVDYVRTYSQARDVLGY